MSFTVQRTHSKPIPYGKRVIPSWACIEKKTSKKTTEKEANNEISLKKIDKSKQKSNPYNYYIPRPTKSLAKLFESPSQREAYNAKLNLIIEIFKHFSHPLKKNVSYMSETQLVSYPNPYKIEFKRGGVTTQWLRFSNLTLEPVFITIYKFIPDLEQLKIGNMSWVRSQRIPTGLSYDVSLVYKDSDEKPIDEAKIVFVASRNTATPCFQVCDIDLEIYPLRLNYNMRP